MTLFYALLLCCGLLLPVGLFLLRGNRQVVMLLPAMGISGGVMILLSLFLSPWVTYADSTKLVQNAAAVSSQTQILEQIKQLPGFKDIQMTGGMSSQEILDILITPSTQGLRDAIYRSDLITGWRLADIGFAGNSLLSVLLLLGFLLSLVNILFGLLQYFRADLFRNKTIFFLPFIAILLILIMLEMLPSIDVLGNLVDLRMRLFAVLAETEVGWGVWYFFPGLLLCGIAGLAPLIYQSPSNYEFED